MTLLIVDDEYYVVQGIVENTDWQALGIDTVLSAYSFPQAKKLFTAHPIDILLSDIEMSQGSGLEMMEWLEENGYHPVKLLLSAHQKFEYAQKAVSLQCLEYILKPVNSVTMGRILKKAVAKAIESKETLYVQKNFGKGESNRRLLIRLFWESIYLDNNENNYEDVIKAVEKYNMPQEWLQQDFYLLYIRSTSQNSIPLSNDEAELFLSTISEIIEKDLTPCTYKNEGAEFCIALNAAEYNGYESFCTASIQVLREIGERLNNYHFTFYAADKAQLYLLSENYKYLKNAAAVLFSITNSLFPVNTLSDTASCGYSEVHMKKLPLNHWTDLLLNRKSDQIIEEVTGFFHEHFFYSTRILVSLYYGLLQVIYKAMAMKNIPAEEFYTSIFKINEIVNLTSSIDLLKEWAVDVLHMAEDILSVNTAPDQFEASLRRFIQDNLGDINLNRSLIADYFHMNPDYISYLFRKKTGELLSEYILQERIGYARKLLLTTELSLQDISERTGFSNSSYFHKQFKKMTGYTPKQYRSQAGGPVNHPSPSSAEHRSTT